MLPCEKGRCPTASPLFNGKTGLTAEAEGLDRLLVAINCCQLEIIEQLAAAGDKLQETTAGVVILGIILKVAGDVIDTLRQDGDLDIGAAGVFVVQFETGGGGCDFAHGGLIWENAGLLVRRVVSSGNLKGRDDSTKARFGKGFFTMESRLFPLDCNHNSGNAPKEERRRRKPATPDL